ncbi:MAG: DsrE family protein [Deltaproteobacteria bacterium]|nr:DsrE family protein [Deltaproteobacteria bacterium]
MMNGMKGLAGALVATALLWSGNALAQELDKHDFDPNCPVELLDELDDETTAADTRCLVDKKPKMLVTIGRFCMDGDVPEEECVSSEGEKPYALFNILLATKDYEVHGFDLHSDVEIVAVAYAGGGGLMEIGNPWAGTVDSLMGRGVTFYICQNTMKKRQISTDDLIPGVLQVPKSITAIVDFQSLGYHLYQF